MVENLIVNKEGRIPDIGYFAVGLDPVSTPRTLIVHDQEYHTSYWGHVGLLGLRDHVLLPGVRRLRRHRRGQPRSRPTPTVADLAHAQGGLVGLRPSVRQRSRSRPTPRTR